MRYMHTIGVFDSGIGGLSVAKTIQAAFPDAHVIFRDDHEHMPYGSKPPEVVLQLVVPILQQLADAGCDVIVIACNTVTTTLIAQLRELINVPLVGIEPMIKPAAAQTKSGVIAVCATPATLGSERYGHLKQKYASHLTVLEPDCSQWAAMIEQNHINETQIRAQIEQVCEQGADVIVLGCTHYHWIADLIASIANGRANVIHPEDAIVRRLTKLFTAPAL